MCTQHTTQEGQVISQDEVLTKCCRLISEYHFNIFKMSSLFPLHKKSAKKKRRCSSNYTVPDPTSLVDGCFWPTYLKYIKCAFDEPKTSQHGINTYSVYSLRDCIQNSGLLRFSAILSKLFPELHKNNKITH